ncbi:MAG: hypothetical protein H7A49_01030 [Akkermansiaceae bacterium]|nr:hypothetical protein [Akkermansiaceae bacterium]MCP5542467.1 hypothetical protein [Akkermansiaceae bacterium]MCP5545998.1 hypothetical protein [Akkermansiaceae bacterium]
MQSPFRFRILLPLVFACSPLWAQQEAATTPVPADAEIMAEPIPADVTASAVAAVKALGDQVVLGRYETAIEKMNPMWKERAAKRIGGMEKLEAQLKGVAKQMVQQGISMISFQPKGQPSAYEVWPGKKVVTENGRQVERLVHTKYMVLVPTVTRFRILRQGDPKPLVIESTGFQVAIRDKEAEDWTFIDGASLGPNDLRSLFITLPQDIKLPPVNKREVR